MPYKLRKAPNRDLYWVVAQDGTKKSKDPIPKERAEAQMRALYASMHSGQGLKGGAGVKKRLNTLFEKFEDRWIDNHPELEHAQFYINAFMTHDDWDRFVDMERRVKAALTQIGRTNINRSWGILRPIQRDQTKVAQKHAILERLSIALESLLNTASASAITAQSEYSLDPNDRRILHAPSQTGPLPPPFEIIIRPPQIPPIFNVDYVINGPPATAATVAAAVLPPPPTITIQNPMHTAPPRVRKSPPANPPNHSHNQMIQRVNNAVGNQTPRQIVDKLEDGNLPIDVLTLDEIETDDPMCDIYSGGQWQSKYKVYYHLSTIRDLFANGDFNDPTTRNPITAVSPYRASISEHVGSGRLVGEGHSNQLYEIYDSYIQKWKDEHPYQLVQDYLIDSNGVLYGPDPYEYLYYPLPNQAIWGSIRTELHERYSKMKNIGRSGKNWGILKPRSEKTEREKKKDKIIRDFRIFMNNKYNAVNRLPYIDKVQVNGRGGINLNLRLGDFFTSEDWPRNPRVEIRTQPRPVMQNRRVEDPTDPQRPPTPATEPQPLEYRSTRPRPPPPTVPPTFSFWNLRPTQVHPEPPAGTGLETVLTVPTFNIPDDDDVVRRIGRGKKKAKFQENLTSIGIEPSEYLAVIKLKAKEHGYNPSTIEFADDGKHKIQMTAPNGKLVKFGRIGYNDHLMWLALEKNKTAKSGTAQKKRDTFWKSHSEMKGKWREDHYSPNWLSMKLLW